MVISDGQSGRDDSPVDACALYTMNDVRQKFKVVGRTVTGHGSWGLDWAINFGGLGSADEDYRRLGVPVEWIGSSAGLAGQRSDWLGNSHPPLFLFLRRARADPLPPNIRHTKKASARQGNKNDEATPAT